MSSLKSWRNERVFVAGHRGMVGRALERRLGQEDCEILTADRQDIDLRNQAAVDRWMHAQKPTVVFLAAAKVGGILANSTYPADFLYDNQMISATVIRAAKEIGVKKLVFLGSSCIYPKFADQPITEDSLLTGALEPTNEAYAIAKIAGLKLAEAMMRQHGCDFISAMPTNLYGPGDNYDLESSHVIPALLRKAHMARETGAASMTIWGTGEPRREFLHCDDCADALVLLATEYSGLRHVNVGSGTDLPIKELAQMVMDTVGFKGVLEHDLSKPDGTPRKLMDDRVLRKLGWRPQISLRDGLASTYEEAQRSWHLRR